MMISEYRTRLGLGCSLFLLCWAQLSAAQPHKPNVLLLMVDDLKPALGCYGDKVAQTPHLDALAARGLRFEKAYCNQAVCAPSRFTLMLGAHSTTTGLYGLGSQLRKRWPEATTLPQYFQQHGYRTESVGKVFHIGHGNEGDPSSFMVPHWKDKVIEYVLPASTAGGQLTREEALFGNEKLGAIRSLPRGAAWESAEGPDEMYADGRVAAETVKRLQAAKLRREEEGTPFFLAAGFVRPHLPFCAPRKYWDLYKAAELPMPSSARAPQDAPPVAQKRGGEIAAYAPLPDADVDITEEQHIRQLIHGYYACTSYVDAQLGKVLLALKRLGLEENTIVVLWGDHGFHLGDHGIWTKHTNYEQATRIPLIVAAPGITVPGSSTAQLAETVDLYPTLVELAGLPPRAVELSGSPKLDGCSLVPVLKDTEKRVRSYAYHVYPKQKMGRAIRTERYRLVEWAGQGTTVVELYDMKLDPEETVNVAKQQPEAVAELLGLLARHPKPVK